MRWECSEFDAFSKCAWVVLGKYFAQFQGVFGFNIADKNATYPFRWNDAFSVGTSPILETWKLTEYVKGTFHLVSVLGPFSEDYYVPTIPFSDYPRKMCGERGRNGTFPWGILQVFTSQGRQMYSPKTHHFLEGIRCVFIGYLKCWNALETWAILSKNSVNTFVKRTAFIPFTLRFAVVSDTMILTENAYKT